MKGRKRCRRADIQTDRNVRIYILEKKKPERVRETEGETERGGEKAEKERGREKQREVDRQTDGHRQTEQRR